jgi:type I restriction enzyme S subunit
MVILRNTSPTVDNAYQYLILRSRIVAYQIERLAFGSAQPQLTVKGIITLKIPLPPIKAEQEAIAEVLTDADDLIESLEQLIAKKRQIKQGAMQELLTGKRRLPGFANGTIGYKQTDVGVIPEDWSVSKLGRHVTFKTGPFGSALHKSDYVYGGVPVINPMHIVDGKIEPSRSMAISEQAARKLSDFRLFAGDIVIGRRGEMGRCAFVNEKQQGWLCGTGSMIIRPSSAVDGRFLQRVVSSPRVIAAIENTSVGSTMINLNQRALGNLTFALPPTKAEQEAIAEILSDMDVEIAALEAKLAKARQIKQGMMHNLLTGRIRLV